MLDCGSTSADDSRDPRASRVPELVHQGLMYVPSVARRYRGLGLDFDELISAGNLGLVEAALRFDWEGRLGSGCGSASAMAPARPTSVFRQPSAIVARW